MPIIVFQFVLLLVVPDATSACNFQEEKIYTVSDVSVKPEPIMGLKEFQNRWSKKVAYPKEAIKKNVQGMVFSEFIVDKDGSIHEAAV
ncbi:MAG TPA: energy transducer TonB, partial [Chryseosolibacter sp.]